MHFNPLFALAALIASTSALSTGNYARSHNHRAIAAARLAQPADASANVPRSVRKRANGKRCRPRSSAAATSTHVAVSTTQKQEEVQATSTKHTEKPTEPTSTKQAEATPDKPANTPTPTTTKAPTTTHTTPTPEATTTTKSSSSSSGISFLAGTNTGEGTFYATGLGACGITNNDGDMIAAASHLLFDSYPGYDGVNPNKNPMCNKKVNVQYQGKSITVTLTDRCTGCALRDLDFSPTAFNKLSDPSVGRITGMTWEWA